MSNGEIYHYLIRKQVPSPIAAQAADIISTQQDELGETSLSRMGLKALLDSVVALVDLEGEKAIESLERMLV